MNPYLFKVGDTFDLGGDASLLVDDAEIPPGFFDGVTILAHVSVDNGMGEPQENSGFAEITGAWLDQDAGLYHVEAGPGTTSTWPIGKSVIDIAFTWLDGRRVTTDTMAFRTVPRVPAPIP